MNLIRVYTTDVQFQSKQTTQTEKKKGFILYDVRLTVIFFIKIIFCLSEKRKKNTTFTLNFFITLTKTSDTLKIFHLENMFFYPK